MCQSDPDWFQMEHVQQPADCAGPAADPHQGAENQRKVYRGIYYIKYLRSGKWPLG